MPAADAAAVAAAAWAAAASRPPPTQTAASRRRRRTPARRRCTHWRWPRARRVGAASFGYPSGWASRGLPRSSRPRMPPLHVFRTCGWGNRGLGRLRPRANPACAL
eukprot:299210-Chlamydomonas_euryale.AAC.1